MGAFAHTVDVVSTQHKSRKYGKLKVHSFQATSYTSGKESTPEKKMAISRHSYSSPFSYVEGPNQPVVSGIPSLTNLLLFVPPISIYLPRSFSSSPEFRAVASGPSACFSQVNENQGGPIYVLLTLLLLYLLQ